MRTVENINQEIASLTKSNTKTIEVKERNKIRKQLVFLREVKLYAETEPNEAFVKKQIADINHRMLVVKKGAPIPPSEELTNSKEFKRVLKSYEKENKVPLLKKQLSTLKFLLKNTSV